MRQSTAWTQPSLLNRPARKHRTQTMENMASSRGITRNSFLIPSVPCWHVQKDWFQIFLVRLFLDSQDSQRSWGEETTASSTSTWSRHWQMPHTLLYTYICNKTTSLCSETLLLPWTPDRTDLHKRREMEYTGRRYLTPSKQCDTANQA